jgi:hypothetical protein
LNIKQAIINGKLATTLVLIIIITMLKANNIEVIMIVKICAYIGDAARSRRC